jgi:hypothetical protein
MESAHAERPLDPPGRHDRAWLLAALGVYLALNAWVISTRTYWPRYDSAVYISGATALARGVGLRDVTSPVTRPAESWAHVPAWVRRSPEAMNRPDWPFYGQYPPLLCVMLAPLVTLGGGRFVVLQILPLAAGLATIGLGYRWRETLFPGPWRLTLLVLSGSMLTVFGSRVQTEAVHALFALATLYLLARAGEADEAFGRRVALAAVVLFLGTAVHVRLVFFAAGAAVWLVVGPRVSLPRRVLAAAAFAAATILPALAFTFSASWAGRTGLPLAEDTWTLSHNPYYWSQGWDPSAPQVDRASAAAIYGRRAAAAGRLLWNGLSAGSAKAPPEVLALVGLAAAAALALPWWRHRRGLLALPTLAYVAAVLLSPWTETRMAVPVLPAVAYGLAVAVARAASLLAGHDRLAVRQALVAAGALVLFAQAGNWRWLSPQRDEYALECAANGVALGIAVAAVDVPGDRVVLAPVDNAAFALVTGRATLSPFPVEWKMSDPRPFLAGGGAPVIFGPPTPKSRLGPDLALGGELVTLAGPRARQVLDLGGDFGVVAEWVIVPPPPAGTVPHEPVVPGRIHPRWMRLTPADREPLARAAIPAAAR